jgi:hypothetical protein
MGRGRREHLREPEALDRGLKVMLGEGLRALLGELSGLARLFVRVAGSRHDRSRERDCDDERRAEDSAHQTPPAKHSAAAPDGDAGSRLRSRGAGQRLRGGGRLIRWERLRLACLLLAVLAPWLAYVSHVRDVRRLHALEMHGELVHGTVTQASRAEGVLRYAYGVDGSRYAGTVAWPHVPYVAGESIVVYCLPDSPSFSRPGALLSLAAIDLEADTTSTRHLMADLFAFFAAAGLVAELERRRRRTALPATIARLAALAALGGVLYANLGAYPMSVEEHALDPMALGVPAGVVAPLVETVLLLPFLWLLPLLARWFVHAKGERPAGLRPILLAGLGYGVILLATLVAFTGGGRF